MKHITIDVQTVVNTLLDPDPKLVGEGLVLLGLLELLGLYDAIG